MAKKKSKTSVKKKKTVKKAIKKKVSRSVKAKSKTLKKKKPVKKSAVKSAKRKGKRTVRQTAVRRKKASIKIIRKKTLGPRISKAKQKRLQHYKNILLAKRRNVMEGIEKLRESAKGTESENISKYYDHPAEYGTDTMDREQYFLFISREEKYLQEIERSLEAIETGVYGTCRVCGKEIDVARLEAVPTTRICITCKMADQKARMSKMDFS